MFKLFIILFVIVLAGEPLYHQFEQVYVARENRMPRQVQRTVQGTVSAAMTIDAWCWIYNKRRGVTDASVSSCTGIAIAGASVSGAFLTAFWSDKDWRQLGRMTSSLGEGIRAVAGGASAEGGQKEQNGASTT